MGRFALALCDLAGLVLPRPRKVWGDAMKAELNHIGDGRSALIHASGCCVAAVKARALDFDTRFAAGIWSVALASVAFALFHITCASRGVDVLLGAPDGFLEALQRSGRADTQLVASYRSAMPIVVACLFGLGFAHLAAAWFLFRMQLQRFLFAWFAALLIAIVAVAIQVSIVWSPDGLPSEFFALLVQTVALPLLLLWSNGRHRHLRRIG
jgi:hypothetical protein